MRRDLVELLAAYQAVVLQLSQRLRQHGVGDAGQILFQLTEAHGIMDAHFVHQLRLPFALQHDEQGRYGTITIFGDDALL